MSPLFVHSELLWGLLAVGVPLLIHLINMMRHRRVPWAAMEFLLVSQKKHRTWIILKQLLLLLLRMLAIAAVVMMIAGPMLHNQWGNFLGNTRTHHIVLLDDSYSMSDRSGDTSAFDEAKAAINRIAAAAAHETQPQNFTLLRFSQVGNLGATQADFLRERVDAEFPLRLGQKLGNLQASETAAGPLPALEAIASLLGDSEGDRQILYLVSDFRTREWDEPTDLKKRLAQFSESGMQLHLLDCVEKRHDNMAIVGLAPVPGTHAAGVGWKMQVAVQNYGAATRKNVAVLLNEDGHVRPSVTIAEIPPGKTVAGQFDVYLSVAGPHHISARLDGDAVAADNTRFAVVDLPAALPVLLVDGDPGGSSAHYLATALAPGGQVRTGLQPRIEQTRFLNSHPLDDYYVICLADVEHLDQPAVDALEKYVAGGGGVIFFLGERSRALFINKHLYRDGHGLFPLPLDGPAELPVDRLDKAPDMAIEGHSLLFDKFAEHRNAFFNLVLIERYFAATKGAKPADSTVRVLSRLRNGAPLVAEREFGKGRVVAVLTSASPTWNNWATNPSFVAMMQNLPMHLRRDAEAVRIVGSPIELSLDPGVYQPQLRFQPPREDRQPAITVDAVQNKGRLTAAFPHTGHSGFYDVRLTKTGGKNEVRAFAVNVDPVEGDLRMLGGPELAVRLGSQVKAHFALAAKFQSAADEMAGYNLSETLMYVLIALLIAEQIVAWSASYHSTPAGARAAPGGSL